MKKLTRWAAFGILLGSSFDALAAGPAVGVGARAENRARFGRVLRERKLERADAFAIYFSSPQWGLPSPEERELLAQYYLMTCRPRAAAAQIALFENPVKRALFGAVLSALISVEREAAQAGSVGGAKHEATVSLPVDAKEIWPDEWQGLRLANEPCARMPVVGEARGCEKHRAAARAAFEGLRAADFRRDFNIVALALDVGARLPDVAGLLAHYSGEHENLYYRKLQNLVLSRAEGASPLAVSAVAKDSITFQTLSLRAARQVAGPVSVPILISDLDKETDP